MSNQLAKKPVYYSEAGLKNFAWKWKIDINNLLMSIAITFLFSGPPTGLAYIITKIAKYNYGLETIILSFPIFFSMIFFYILAISNHNTQVTRSTYFHKCFHDCRNETENIINNLKNPSSGFEPFSQLYRFICESTRDFFETIKRNDKNNHVGVAIRMAGDGGLFSTHARSGLNCSRGKTTQPLKKDEGVAKLLLSNNASGCLIYGNVKETDDESYYYRYGVSV